MPGGDEKWDPILWNLISNLSGSNLSLRVPLLLQSKAAILPRFQTPRGRVLCWWPPSSCQTAQPCLGRLCQWGCSTTEGGGLSPWFSNMHPPLRPLRAQIDFNNLVIWKPCPQADVPQHYLVARHLKDIAEASSADVICHLIRDLKRVLKWGSTDCGHIWTRENKTVQNFKRLFRTLQTGSC